MVAKFGYDWLFAVLSLCLQDVFAYCVCNPWFMLKPCIETLCPIKYVLLPSSSLQLKANLATCPSDHTANNFSFNLNDSFKGTNS